MRRAALLFVIFILVGWVFVPAAHAQVPTFNPMPNAEEFGAIVDKKTKDGQMSKEVYTVNTQASYMNTATCMITGCSSNPESGFYYKKSAIAYMGNAVIAMYANPPADLALWIKDTGQTLGFIPRQVNAQGIGFSGLSVLLPLWKGFRNIAYALLAVVMVVIGFMVMLRKKIDPKTVVTVQNALPKIVITLILITFSYAIVGFMIDLMYLTIALIASLLIPVSNGALGADTATKYMNGGIWSLFAMVFGGGLSAVNDITSLLAWSVGLGTSSLAQAFIFWNVPGLLIAVIVAIALLIAWIRILFLLVGAYIQILISLFVGPLQILTEAFPGSTGFSSWFKNLFANVAVFPVTAAMLMVGTMLAKFNNNTARVWTPPLLSSGGTSGWIGIIGLGILFAIPGIANSIKEALKAKAPVNAGPGAIFGPIGSGAGQVFQLGYQASFIGSQFLHKPKPTTPPARQI
ncbi:MAG: hypothetical protein NT149_01720, partial [Candidatus Gottesmanbacteria bacterium]|nr:hypothetical protein [Candidatus Gottesmanbacteria bacterium]